MSNDEGTYVANKLAVIALLFSAIGLATPKSLDLGGLVLSVSDAPTTQIFHINILRAGAAI